MPKVKNQNQSYATKKPKKTKTTKKNVYVQPLRKRSKTWWQSRYKNLIYMQDVHENSS